MTFEEVCTCSYRHSLNHLSMKSLYEIAKPISKIGMGFDQLPENIKNSKILTGNDQKQLKGVQKS